MKYSIILDRPALERLLHATDSLRSALHHSLQPRIQRTLPSHRLQVPLAHLHAQNPVQLSRQHFGRSSLPSVAPPQSQYVLEVGGGHEDPIGCHGERGRRRECAKRGESEGGLERAGLEIDQSLVEVDGPETVKLSFYSVCLLHQSIISAQTQFSPQLLQVEPAALWHRAGPHLAQPQTLFLFPRVQVVLVPVLLLFDGGELDSLRGSPALRVNHVDYLAQARHNSGGTKLIRLERLSLYFRQLQLFQTLHVEDPESVWRTALRGLRNEVDQLLRTRPIVHLFAEHAEHHLTYSRAVVLQGRRV